VLKLPSKNCPLNPNIRESSEELSLYFCQSRCSEYETFPPIGSLDKDFGNPTFL
jgi:hypothetical protein